MVRATAGAVDVGRSEALVGAGGDGDLIFAGGVDADEGHAGGGARIADDVLDVHAFGLQAAKEGASAVIGADAAEEGDAGAEPGGGYGLVRAFAAGWGVVEFGAGDGFARSREAGGADEEIGVGTAEDYDVGAGWFARGHVGLGGQ